MVVKNPVEIGEAITFVRKISKQGDYYSIFVPKEYIDTGLVDPTKIYQVWLKPIGEREKKED